MVAHHQGGERRGGVRARARAARMPAMPAMPYGMWKLIADVKAAAGR
jgi:hypothetical protein